jgi:tRNA pseudouridine13 synthase
MQLPEEVLTPPAWRPAALPECIIRAQPEDFRVQELPAYEASGSGEHFLLLIEKRGIATSEVVRHVARTLRIDQRDIGCAGQKDRHAVTQQYLSVPAACEAALPGIETDTIRLITAARHCNKLRTGHLIGNRFQLVLRHPESQFSEQHASVVREQLQQVAGDGMPNYFGTQRFGHRGDTAVQGCELLGSEGPPSRRARRMKPWLKRLALSAAQSAIFNVVTAGRVRDGSIAVPGPGDIVIRKGGRRPFAFPEAAATPADEDEHPVVLITAGPMHGPKMTQTSGRIAEAEHAALARFGLTEEAFTQFSKLCQGTRRPMLVFPDEVACQLMSDGSLNLQFELPPGSFATVLLREMFAHVHDAAAHHPTDEREPTTSA